MTQLTSNNSSRTVEVKDALTNQDVLSLSKTDFLVSAQNSSLLPPPPPPGGGSTPPGDGSTPPPPGDGSTPPGDGSTPPPSGDSSNPLPSPVVPTVGDDNLVGTVGNDVFDSLAGNDNVTGLDGDDLLLGNDGNDILNGGNGNDKITGGNGNDKVIGGSGNDKIIDGNGQDKIWSGAGIDVITATKDKVRDVFALERGEGYDIIRNFSDRIDKLGLTPGLSFKKLKITSQGHNTVISVGSDRLAVLIGVKATQIQASDFTQIAAG